VSIRIARLKTRLVSVMLATSCSSSWTSRGEQRPETGDELQGASGGGFCVTRTTTMMIAERNDRMEIERYSPHGPYRSWKLRDIRVSCGLPVF
jgi:hypothetical protein